MTEERRAGDRRVDPDAWSAEHKRRVLFIYGLVVGGVLMLAGVVVIVWIVTNESVSNINAALGVALVAGGLVASMPSVFLPVFSAVLKKIPWGKGHGNGDITRAIPRITGDEE